jgi:hypothetical protein
MTDQEADLLRTLLRVRLLRCGGPLVQVAVAVDPGVVKGGLAIYIDGLLVRAETVRAPTPRAWAAKLVDSVASVLRGLEGADVEWVVERMVKRRGKAVKHSDLDRVERSVEALKDMIRQSPSVRGRIVRVKPEAWKAQIPKPICHARSQKILSHTERLSILDTGHDALDAVGIGLFHIGRAKRGMVSR